MKRTLLSLALVAAICGSTSPAQAAKQGNWIGRVSDRKCGRNVDHDCNKKCIDGGEAPVFVLDETGEILTVSNPDSLKQHPGEHLAVAGVLSGDVLTVGSVTILPEAKVNESANAWDGYEGNYLIADHHIVGIDRFVMDDGNSALLFSDYSSGIVRRLFPVSDTRFTMGPGFAVQSPVELTVGFLKNAQGGVTGITLKAANEPEHLAVQIPLHREEVRFHSGDAVLAGTLFVPETPGPHPAIILLHGSGALTRNSFGPYPHFFTSLGLAVLIYDKRGSGASTGTLMEKAAYYPDDVAQDALAAFQFLQGRGDINHNEIGLWGSSEGGMLTTQVAARSREVAFVINSSGFMMPLWQQLLYKVKAVLRANGFSSSDIKDAEAFQTRRLRVARTGQGLPEFQALQARSRNKKWFFLFAGGTTSLDEMRWQWSHVYAFDPLPAATQVKCPALGLFGGLDIYTPASITASNMRRAMAEGGNEHVTIKIFPRANHELAEARTGSDKEIPKLKRQVPGLFETLASWVLKQVTVQK